MGTNWIRTRCDASMQNFYSYGGKKVAGPDEAGRAACPTCGKVVKLANDQKGRRTRIPAHNFDFEGAASLHPV